MSSAASLELDRERPPAPQRTQRQSDRSIGSSFSSPELRRAASTNAPPLHCILYNAFCLSNLPAQRQPADLRPTPRAIDGEISEYPGMLMLSTELTFSVRRTRPPGA